MRGYTGGYGNFSDQYWDKYYEYLFTGGGGGFSGGGGGFTISWETKYTFTNGSTQVIRDNKGNIVEIRLPEIGIGYSRGSITVGTNGTNGDGWFTASDWTNNGVGGAGTGMTYLNGSFRLTNGSANGSQISPKYYESNWTGGSKARITTYSAAKWGSRISKGSILVSTGLGAYNINQANIKDGRTFGYNTQVATAQTLGGIGGAMAGAEMGAAIGVWFGGVGAVPGAVIGGIIGGIAGGWGGSELGGAVVDWIWFY